MLSCGASVIMWLPKLSCGSLSYYVGADIIIWVNYLLESPKKQFERVIIWCYHVMIMRDNITLPFYHSCKLDSLLSSQNVQYWQIFF
jgi:hypothetical protein